MSYLSDFEELNGGYVSCGGNPKGGKISGKGKIKTGKFEVKVDEGFLVGYSVSSKAFRVFNSLTRIIQETLHENFLENKPNVAGSGPTWLFDIESLTRTMNYQPVNAGNQTNPSASFQDKFNAEKAGEDINQQYVLFPVWSSSSTNPLNNDEDAAFKGKEHYFDAKKHESEVNVSLSSNAQSKKQDDKTKKEAKGKKLEDITCSDDEDVVGVEADFNNLETSITDGIDYKEIFAPVPRIEAIRLFLAYAFFMGFMMYQMDVKSVFLYGNIEEEVYVYQPLGFKDPNHPDNVYKVIKALYGLHHALRAWYETLANYLLENGFQRGKIDQTLFTKKQKRDILLVQIYVDDIIFGATNKDLCKSFKKLMKDKFQMSSMRELTFFLGLQVKQKKYGIFISQDKYVAEILKKFGLTEGKSASTPIDTKKPLLKDTDGEDVDVHIYSDPKSFTPSCSKEDLWISQRQAILGLVVNDVTRLQVLVDKKKVVVTDIREDKSLRKEEMKLSMLKMLLLVMMLKEMILLLKEKFLLSLKNNLYHLILLLLYHHNHLKISHQHPRKVEHLKYDKVAQALKITKLKRMVKKLKKGNRVRVLKLCRLKRVGTSQRIDTSNDTMMDDESNQGRIIDEINKDDVVALMDDKKEDKKDEEDKIAKEDETTKVQEVVDVVTTAKLITKVVTAASEIVTAASDVAIGHVKHKAKEDLAFKRYQDIKRKPQTEAQARKNMIMYLKNVAGFKLDYFKGISYDDIHPIFETPAEKAAKRRKLNEEVDDLKKQLKIVPDEDDDVYTKATPLATKVPIVDYKIIGINNKPYYKIIRADGIHQCTCSSLEESKDYTWSSKGQELEATRIMWCAYHNIYNHSADFLGGKKVPTLMVYTRSDVECNETLS
uniref:Retrovirus-related Pol polyprotein from transposon TNT 1-94 n=1 Tax=Tanacetum cinerariifolium TaxID=118510 RepID=A0A6L2NBA1_TANCI|nr:retrovirus-related Pol polyprotein from transposon TNT 1-94 [Tanacetum cinerariifolium]